MAHGDTLGDSPAGSDAFLIRSSVRSGLKREFVFALRVQAELPASLGRTRSRKTPLTPVTPIEKTEVKRPKVLDAGAGAFPVSSTPSPPSSKKEGSSESPIVVDEAPEVCNGTIMDSPIVIDIIDADEETPTNNRSLNKSDGVEDSVLEVTPLPPRTKQEGSPEAPVVIDNPSPEVWKGPMMDPSPPAPQAGFDMEMADHHDATQADSDMHEKSTRRVTRSAVKTPTGDLVAVVASPPIVGSVDETRGGISSKSETPRVELQRKMELKMSKKISVTKLPSNIRELLGTGLLEGMPVKYITSMKKQVGLKGVIKGTGILCHCDACNGSNAVSAYQFEQHAGSLKKHPSDFIFLANGNTIRDVLEACKAAPLDMLEASIHNAISMVHPKRPPICQQCNEPFHTSDIGRFSTLCDSCLRLKQHQMTPSPLDGNDSSASASASASASTSKNTSSHKKISLGKLTKKDLGLHKLVFVGDTLPEGTEVGYYVGGKIKLQGYIKDSGIFCSCCSTVVSPSQFENHAGHAQRRKPYNNIYTSNGVSLHELSVSLSKGRKLSSCENDDLCSICADGGDLLLCDLCPRAFHIDCVGLSSIPSGDWYCRYCQNMHQREKCLEHNDNAIAAGRIAGVDPIEQIFKRCIRIVETPETYVGGCVFCRRHDFTKGFGPRTVLFCDQCEKEYHVGCLKDHGMCDLKEIPKEEWFCCTDCSRIHAVLQELVIRGEVRLEGLDSDIIRRKRGEKGLLEDANADVRWRLLSGKSSDADSRPMLSTAVTILHESFDPIVESASDRDLIPCMVYGRSTRDQDFGGMYCAILTVNSTIVSTGILRILGSDVAELPLVATGRESQGQGCFQSLFTCIERLLASLNVKHFVLPAAEEAESIWTKKFGFERITTDQLHEYTRGAHTMIFQGTSMLHKPVPNRLKDLIEGCQRS